MIALAASILLALYIIIPGLLSRFVYRLFIPLRVLAVGRTEEASRALATAMLPFLLALFVVWYVPGLDRFPLKADPQFKEQDYKLIASCLYSEATFAKEEPMFWSALQRSISRQILFLFWYYSLTILTALSLGYLTASYGRFGSNRAYRWLANKFLLPRISEWHPLLTPFVFADKQTAVRADILTTTDNLYRGRIAQHFVDTNGKLTGLILTDALRFDRHSYLRQSDAEQKPKASDFWREIPGAKMYLFADKIVNLNLNYESAEPVQDALANFVSEWLDREVQINVDQTSAKVP